MAGTIFDRLLPRSRTTSTPPTQLPQTTRDTSSQSSITMDSVVASNCRKISFDSSVNTKTKGLVYEIHRRPMHNNRKDSYASIREDQDALQSFKSRRFSTEPSPYGSDEDEATFDEQPWKLTAEEDEDVEDAVSDESDISGVATPSDTSLELVQQDKPVTLEGLPDEILDNIYRMVQIDGAQESYLRPRVDLFSCLVVSKRTQAAALRVLYRHVTIYQSKMFRKFVSALNGDAALGRLVQHLDFSHYSQLGYGRSRGETNGTPWLTKETLNFVLRRTTQLKTFLVHEHIDDELDREVLSSLFSIPTLQAVDFASCTSRMFVDSFTSMWSNGHLSASPLQLKRLCLHECGTLKSSVFEAILPRLGQLTHLDVAHTMVTDKALLSIPNTARITHLNLGRCNQITSDGVVQFLVHHPAVKDTLVWLDISADASRYRLLEEDDLTCILAELPTTLTSLNIGGAKITSTHTPALRLLATHLEELGLKGAELGLAADVARILHLKSTDDPVESCPRSQRDSGVESQLRYIDLTDVRAVTQMSLLYSPLKILDAHSMPLEVIELGPAVLTEITRRNKNVPAHLQEWTVKELGRRGWYVRNPSHLPAGTRPDNGYRSYKMGARWWGARKIPMLEQEVGGMYGYFMFKRN